MRRHASGSKNAKRFAETRRARAGKRTAQCIFVNVCIMRNGATRSPARFNRSEKHGSKVSADLLFADYGPIGHMSLLFSLCDGL